MNIVILGAGRVGFYLARQLINEGKKVTLIERDPAVAKQVDTQLDCLVINEPGNSVDVLQDAGVDQADFFISLTDSDEMNLLACGIVSGAFSKPLTIARVRNMDYSRKMEWEKPVFGIDYVLNPEIEAAAEIIDSVRHGAVSNVMRFKDSEIQIRIMQVSDDSQLVGRSLKDIRNSLDTEFIVPFIYRYNDYLIPGGDTVVETRDELYVLATAAGFKSMYALNNKKTSEIKKIAIVGGGNVSCYIADSLISDGGLRERQKKLFSRLLSRIQKPSAAGRTLHFIDKDYERCKFLAERYPGAIVSNADISEEGFLEDGNLEGYDLLISATGNQELNIITSMYAKSRGIGHVIALVNKINYQKMTRHMGVDVCVSMNNATVNSILKRIRKGNIKSLHTLASSSYEILELELSVSSVIAGKKIKDVRLPRQCLILLVFHEGASIIPYGELTLEASDTIVLASHKSTLSRVEGIFSGK